MNDATHNTNSTPAKIEQDGIGYYANLRGAPLGATDLNGVGYFHLLVNSDIYIGATADDAFTNINLNYVHDKSVLGLPSISFDTTNTLGISIGFQGAHDDMAASCTISYSTRYY